MPARVIRCVLNCIVCEKQFERTNSRIKSGTDKYCSYVCVAQDRDKTILHSNNERKIVRPINNKLKCNVCGKTKNIKLFGKAKSRPYGVDTRCKDCLREKGKKYYHKNREAIRKKCNSKEYKDKHREYHRNWAKQQYKNNVIYRIKRNMRVRMYKALKENVKQDRFINLLGCTITKFKQHLQDQFKDGMNWQNYGQPGWEIDHIKPCTSFDLSKKSEQQICFHYTNLQPLWGIDNCRKSNKL